MVELNFGEQVLATVRAFLQLGMGTEVIRRIVPGRLYYAGHHLGRLLLRNIGLTPEQWHRDVHRRVINELQVEDSRNGVRYVDTGLMALDALTALRRLHRRRLVADYELDADVVLKEFPDDLAQRSSRIHHHLTDKGLFVAMDFKLVDKQS